MRRLLILLTLAVTAGVAVSVTPAASAGSPDGVPTPDARLTAPGRIVQRVEIGRLGSSDSPIVRSWKVKSASAGRPLEFDVGAATATLASTSVESCWYARPVWRRYNGFGKLASKAWYYMEWCGRDGVVTRVMTLFCGGVGAQGFIFDGCRLRRSRTGTSRVRVSGTWLFPYRVGVYTILTRTVTVDAKHRGSGYTTGTWWMYQ